MQFVHLRKNAATLGEISFVVRQLAGFGPHLLAAAESHGTMSAWRIASEVVEPSPVSSASARSITGE